MNSELRLFLLFTVTMIYGGINILFIVVPLVNSKDELLISIGILWIWIGLIPIIVYTTSKLIDGVTSWFIIRKERKTNAHVSF